MKQILMLHGWGFPATVFSSLIDKLAADFDVWAPDRPGYGSNIDNADSNEVPLLDSPALLIGWSLGGLAALQMTLQQPDKVTGLVLLATTPCFVNRADWASGMDQQAFENFYNQVSEDPSAAMRQFVRLNAGRKPAKQTTRVLSGLSKKVSADALQNGMTELSKTDLRDVIAEIEQPALLLHAADDRVVPAAASRWLQQCLPNTKHFEFQTGGHAFFLQHADEVAEHIRMMA